MASRVRHLKRVPTPGLVVGSLPQQPGSSRAARAATFVTDLMLHTFVALVALWLGGRPLIPGEGPITSMLLFGALYGLMWSTAATALGLYREDLRHGLGVLWIGRVKASVAVFAAAGALTLVGMSTSTLGPAALWALLLSVSVAGLLGACVEKMLTPAKWQRERALLVGTKESIARTAKRLDRRECRLDVVGTLAMDVAELPERAEMGAGPGPETQIVEQVAALDASVVVLTTDAYVLGMHPMQVIWALESTGAVLISDTGMHTMPSRRVALERVGGLVTVKARRRAERSLTSTLSGIAQWCAAACGLLVLAPLFAAIALWVRLDSPGPAFFVQERVGRNGSIFRMYKFRTMVVGAHQIVHTVIVDPNEPNRGPLFKSRQDTRITRVGRFLRKSSLDELPQLINVVRGEMRIVGPRPALPKEVAKYRGYEDRRLACKPGLTGLWQVSGRSDLDWARSVELDQMYVDGHSLGLDTFIVCRTPGAVVSSRGAY